jgi:hypothetical protein
MNKDLHNNIATVMLYEPQNTTADTYSNLVDLQGAESVELLVHCGALTGVDGSNYFEFKVYESDTTAAADFTLVGTNDLLGAFTRVDSTTKDQVIQKVGYIGNKRYLRVLIDETGTITAGIVGVTAILSNGRHQPLTDRTAVSAT